VPIIKSGYAKQRRRRTSEYEHNRRVILGYATRCSITGKAPTPDDPLEIDHIVPIADGGTDHITNLRAVLRSVNRQRGRGSTGGGMGGRRKLGTTANDSAPRRESHSRIWLG